MTTILEAFGRLADTDLDRATKEEERELMRRAAEDPAAALRSAPMNHLHWIFVARAKMMGLLPLWEAYDAGLASEDGDTDPPMDWVYLRLAELGALPALFQCLEDSLGRLAYPGTVDIVGYQLTIHEAMRLPATAARTPGEQWFSSGQGDVPVVMSFDTGSLGGRDPSESLPGLFRSGAGMLVQRGPGVGAVPAEQRVREPKVGPGGIAPLSLSDTGLLATVPEWSADACGWVMAYCMMQAMRTA